MQVTLPAIHDELLRTRIIQSIRAQADAWRRQQYRARTATDERLHSVRASVLEQLATDFDLAVLAELQQQLEQSA